MPIVTYSALRLGLFAVCVAVLYWIGLGSWLLVLVAAFAAWGISYVVLAKPRDKAALYIAERVERRKLSGRRFSENAEQDAAHEDAVVDAAEQRLASDAGEQRSAGDAAEQRSAGDAAEQRTARDPGTDGQD
ncbi:DUF4229 domain-containing protein [Cellulomonas fimi]|uniref:DUF4229 domain-containing protein n=1 Tax=Cellulomonas fimi TaxID=1708 RepID=UPI0028936817|nr:DUF4229 domain-containing protein [Cellulomonas fimi]